MSAPTTLGRYPVKRRLGAGAFASVWLAHDEHLDSPVAIKVLADNWAADDHIRQRFVEEGRFLRRVESPHVVGVYDAGELDDGRPFLVMAFADQGTLADRFTQDPLERGQALEVLRQLAEGLAVLHEQQVLHRDLKPGNVLFRTGAGGRVQAMLGDLGLGKAMDMSSRLTMIAGSPAYVSPEQARGEHLDGRSDQYSLAALAHLLLVGHPAYDHASLSAAAEVTPPDDLAAELPDPVRAVLVRGLSPEREDRYASVDGFIAALVAAVREIDPSVVDVPAPRAWAPADPDLTLAGRSVAATTPDDRTAVRAPAPEPGRRRPRRGLLVAAGALTLVAGAAVGVGVQRAAASEATLSDASGAITVTVPRAWAGVVRDEAWQPPTRSEKYPALSVGAAEGWNGAADPDVGLFVAHLPGEELPQAVPQHPECDSVEPAAGGAPDGFESVTVFYTGCNGPDVVVERVSQVASNRLMWVQLRSPDQPTARRVLEGIELHG